MPALRVIFMGTAQLAGASLQALHDDPHIDVVSVVSQPDRPRGRDLQLRPTPVKTTALACGLPLLQPARARDPEFIGQLTQLRPDLIVVAAYGQILPQTILDLPKHGSLNVHTSLLPKYRGAAPIQFAILNGDPVTGVTIMRMDAGMDTGDVLTQVVTPIERADNAQTLHDRLAELGAQLLTKTIPDWVEGRITPLPQNPAEASYTRKITKEDGHIDWRQPARTIWNQVRGLTPWPGAFTRLPAPQAPVFLKIWSAAIIAPPTAAPPGTVLAADNSGLVIACGPEEALRIDSLQLPGRRRLDTAQFLAGNPVSPGIVLPSGPAPDFSCPNRS